MAELVERIQDNDELEDSDQWNEMLFLTRVLIDAATLLIAHPTNWNVQTVLKALDVSFSNCLVLFSCARAFQARAETFVIF